MNMIITTKKFTVRDALRERIETKLAKFERYFDKDTTAKIVCRTEKDREIMEITLIYDNIVYRVQQTTGDMNASLDACLDVLDRKIRKNKTKLQKRLREGAFTQLEPGAVEEKEPSYDLVKTKHFHLRPMTIEEAILQMEMLGHNFFIYEDAESEEVHVVYRRADGGFGRIIPEK